MKPHPRIRKAIKWGGAAVTVFFVVVWIGSGWWTFEWRYTPSRDVFVMAGMAGWEERGGFSHHLAGTWTFDQNTYPFQWWVFEKPGPFGYSAIGFPLAW